MTDLTAEQVEFEEAILRIRNAAPVMLNALRGARLALIEHLSQAAHDKGVSVEEACACWTVELAAVNAAIALATGEAVQA